MLVKTECLRGRVFTTRAQANLALFEHIKGFHNPRRIQKRPLGWQAPVPGRVLGGAPQRRTDLLDRAPTAGASSTGRTDPAACPRRQKGPGHVVRPVRHSRRAVASAQPPGGS
ncbi:IS3 family transposase [Streptomyces sp. NPDC020792]|uniref:IS3 family transposase n=1 Tax=Streptomyces sp. NPDC020792 TaxID=3365089 RepID=UPI0037ADA0F3